MSEVRVETTRGIRTVTLADVENRNALGAGQWNVLEELLMAMAAAASMVHADRCRPLQRVGLDQLEPAMLNPQLGGPRIFDVF